MERPVYHFKGIVKDGAEATKDFVGPLDLILHLLKKNKIAIRDLPLAGILEQFLAWMETRRALDLAVAGEFIAMASHLMLLKTRMLLSQEDKEAQAEMAALIASLEARQRHASAQRVRAVLPRKKPDKLSASALETLALVAYFQPVTRVYLDQARGVDSAHSLGVLLDRELVEPCGTLDAPGRPTLYRTTQTFLRSFGLSDLADLPPLPEGIPAEAGGAP